MVIQTYYLYEVSNFILTWVLISIYIYMVLIKCMFFVYFCGCVELFRTPIRLASKKKLMMKTQKQMGLFIFCMIACTPVWNAQILCTLGRAQCNDACAQQLKLEGATLVGAKQEIFLKLRACSASETAFSHIYLFLF